MKINKIKKGFGKYLAFSFNKLKTQKGILVAGLIIFIVSHFIFPLNILNAIAENFYKITLGLAALLGVYFGGEFVADNARERAIEHYKNKYPINEYGKKFRIIESEKDPGAIYLHDLETLHKHHIWNMSTVYDLGWQVFDRERLPTDEFNSILIGDPIRTYGDLGDIHLQK